MNGYWISSFWITFITGIACGAIGYLRGREDGKKGR